MTDPNKQFNELTERASKLWGFPLTHNPTPPAGEGPVYYVILVTTVTRSGEPRLAIEVGQDPPANTLEFTGDVAIMRHVNLATRDGREAVRRQDQLGEAVQAKYGGELGYYLADQPEHNNRRKRTAEHKTRQERLAHFGVFNGQPRNLPLDMQDTDHLLELAALAWKGYQLDGRGFLSETQDDTSPIVGWATPDMANAIADQLGEPRLTEAFPLLVSMVNSYDPETEFVYLETPQEGGGLVLKVPCPGGSCAEAWDKVRPSAMPKNDWTP